MIREEFPTGPLHLHPAIKKVWVFSSCVSLLFTLPLFGLGEYVLIRTWKPYPFEFPMVGPLLAILIGLISIAFAKKQYENWTYELRKHDLVLSWGLWWKTRRCVALDRIQHVDINSGPLDRKFGLVQMSVHTAGLAGGVGTIPGLEPEIAEYLREILLSHRAINA